jgi:hypothetical protein
MVYEVLIPSVPFIAGYLFTYAFYKGGLIRKTIHVNIWNFILLVSFIISGGIGFLLLILLEAGVQLQVSQQLLYWHVEFGITMSLVTIFHIYTYKKTSKMIFQGSKRRS